MREKEFLFFFFSFFFLLQFCGYESFVVFPHKKNKGKKSHFFVTFTLKGKKISNFFCRQVAKICHKKKPLT